MICGEGVDIKPARSERGNRQLAPSSTTGGETIRSPGVAEDFDLLRLLLFALVLVVIGGGLFLATWDIPAPTRQVEIVVPDERLPR